MLHVYFNQRCDNKLFQVQVLDDNLLSLTIAIDVFL